MNGNPNARISEHAFGNALDIAEFMLADGHEVRCNTAGTARRRSRAFCTTCRRRCEDFTTVLAPGANVYHYNHIHVDLMRHYDGRHICEPTPFQARSSPNARGRDTPRDVASPPSPARSRPSRATARARLFARI